MAILKCKMCGADLNLSSEDKIVTCDYCGSTQTVPIIDDEKILKLYARGNNLRSQYDFDKAYSLFEQIISEGKEEAEVYWNLLLCKYGITYVDDYNGGKKPTINRMSFDLIMDDPDYENVLEYADALSREVYKAQLKEIHQIQKRIIDISKKEEPYDVFISYKETDVNGDRTEDSVIAQEIYNELTKEGYRVFLSRITLADAVGQEYEPIIYSALYSAPIMILVGTDVDYINATWVKNEWSRYLNMMKKTSKKNIIPCYKYLDAYDLPKEIRNIQSINLSKLGAIQDLIIGVNKLSGKSKKKKESNGNPFANLYATLSSYIEKEMYVQASTLIDQLLIFEPNNYDLYLYKLMVNNECKDVDTLILNFEKYVNNEEFIETKKKSSSSVKIYDFINKLNAYAYQQGKEYVEKKEYLKATNCFNLISNVSEYEDSKILFQTTKVLEIINRIENQYDVNIKDTFGIEEELSLLAECGEIDDNISNLRTTYSNIISQKEFDNLTTIIEEELNAYKNNEKVNINIENNIISYINKLKNTNCENSESKQMEYKNIFKQISDNKYAKKYIYELDKYVQTTNYRTFNERTFNGLVNKLKEYQHIPSAQKNLLKYSKFNEIMALKYQKRLTQMFNELKENPNCFYALKNEMIYIIQKIKPYVSNHIYEEYSSKIEQYEKIEKNHKRKKKLVVYLVVSFVIILFFVFMIVAVCG